MRKTRKTKNTKAARATNKKAEMGALLFTTYVFAIPSILIMFAVILYSIVGIFANMTSAPWVISLVVYVLLYYIPVGVVIHSLIGIQTAKRSISAGGSGNGLLATSYTIITLFILTTISLLYFTSKNPYAGFSIIPVAFVLLCPLLIISILTSLRLRSN